MACYENNLINIKLINIFHAITLATKRNLFNTQIDKTRYRNTTLGIWTEMMIDKQHNWSSKVRLGYKPIGYIPFSVHTLLSKGNCFSFNQQDTFINCTKQNNCMIDTLVMKGWTKISSKIWEYQKCLLKENVGSHWIAAKYNRWES